MQEESANKSPDVSIILATYNECGNLPRLIEKIHESASFDFQIIFIDDGSTDGTREIISEYVKKFPISKYIFNRGKQSILRAHCQGIKASDGKFIIVMDADLQHPPDKIAEIYANLKNGRAIVAGSRYLDGASPGKREPIRGVISRMAALLAKTILRSTRGLSDPLSGFYGFRKDLFKEINGNWRGYESYPFIVASNQNLKPYELPYYFGARVNGESKVVKRFDFITAFLIELVLIKKVEYHYRKQEQANSPFSPHSMRKNFGDVKRSNEKEIMWTKDHR